MYIANLIIKRRRTACRLNNKCVPGQLSFFVSRPRNVYRQRIPFFSRPDDSAAERFRTSILYIYMTHMTRTDGGEFVFFKRFFVPHKFVYPLFIIILSIPDGGRGRGRGDARNAIYININRDAEDP